MGTQCYPASLAVPCRSGCMCCRKAQLHSPCAHYGQADAWLASQIAVRSRPAALAQPRVQVEVQAMGRLLKLSNLGPYCFQPLQTAMFYRCMPNDLLCTALCGSSCRLASTSFLPLAHRLESKWLAKIMLSYIKHHHHAFDALFDLMVVFSSPMGM